MGTRMNRRGTPIFELQTSRDWPSHILHTNIYAFSHDGEFVLRCEEFGKNTYYNPKSKKVYTGKYARGLFNEVFGIDADQLLDCMKLNTRICKCTKSRTFILKVFGDISRTIQLRCKKCGGLKGTVNE